MDTPVATYYDLLPASSRSFLGISPCRATFADDLPRVKCAKDHVDREQAFCPDCAGEPTGGASGVLDLTRELPNAAGEQCHSVLAFGPPGSFKTHCLVIPAVLEWLCRLQRVTLWRRGLPAVRRQGSMEANSRGDAELGEHLAQMPLDGAGADEQLHGPAPRSRRRP